MTRSTTLTPSSRPPAGIDSLAPRPSCVDSLRALALERLPSMLGPDGVCVFRLRQAAGRLVPEGRSLRYTAIALLGLAGEAPATAAAALGGRTPADVLDGLGRELANLQGIGDVALLAWAARCHDAPLAGPALDRLRALAPDTQPVPIVELSWVVSALCGIDAPGLRLMRDRAAARLLGCFVDAADGFPHDDGGGKALRTHVSCFADQVYPILALSHYAADTGHAPSLAAAGRTARHVIACQGEAGQWWWHYDTRNGTVVEGYPVYSVHQHAMAPMALAAYTAASGEDCSSAIQRGLDWLLASPELGGGPLVDRLSRVIWRKVARSEPRKAARYLQAAATRLRPGARVPGLDALLPPGAIDFECRPYELGWLLFAWPGEAA